MIFDRISSDPERMNGQPCIRDLRLTVKRLLTILAAYPQREALFRDFPEVEEEDIRQALLYAATVLGGEIEEGPERESHATPGQSASYERESRLALIQQARGLWRDRDDLADFAAMRREMDRYLDDSDN